MKANYIRVLTFFALLSGASISAFAQPAYMDYYYNIPNGSFITLSGAGFANGNKFYAVCGTANSYWQAHGGAVSIQTFAPSGTTSLNYKVPSNAPSTPSTLNWNFAIVGFPANRLQCFGPANAATVVGAPVISFSNNVLTYSVDAVTTPVIYSATMTTGFPQSICYGTTGYYFQACTYQTGNLLRCRFGPAVNNAC